MKRNDEFGRSATIDFKITIYNVHLSVKFPCRMSLHHGGKPVTTQVSPEANNFTFNQDISLKVSPDDNLEISAYLATEKGGSILAGVISSLASDLTSREGERFSVSLQKCIDPNSVVEMKINHAWVQQPERKTNLVRSTVGVMNPRNNQSPQAKSRALKAPFDNTFETRSEYGGNPIRSHPRKFQGIKPKHVELDKSRRLERERDFLGASKMGGYRLEIGNQVEDDIRETRTIGGPTIRQRRSSKERQRLNAKKMSDETENNLKLDVMKCKMKNEEQEKTLGEKNKTIKELKEQILEFERKNIERAYIQEELSSKENSIRMLEDRVANMGNENMSLRETIAEQIRTIGELKENIRFDIMRNKEDYEKKESLIKQELNTEKSKSAELEMELNNKVSSLNKAKKYIEDLEASAENKIFEHDRMIQELKKDHGQVVKGMSKQIGEQESKIEALLKEIESKTAQIGRLNESILKMQGQDRKSDEKIQTLEMDKNELLIFKNDYNILVKKYQKLDEGLKEEQRTFKKTLESKNRELAESEESLKKNIRSLEAKLTASYEKNKESKARIQQLENTILMGKNEEEKTKKIIAKQEKSIADLHEKLSHAEKENQSLQTKAASLSKENQNKSTNITHIESLYKMELQHSRENIENLTKDLEENNSKLCQARDSLEVLKNEKTKLENKIQLLEENGIRSSDYLKEKKLEFEGKEAEYKNTLKMLNESVKRLEESEKEKQKQINSWEIRELNSKNRIEKAEKSLQEMMAKYEKLEKVSMMKLTEERDSLRKEIECVNAKLSDSIEENKFITNQKKKLESETSKNNKINTVLSEEKLSALNQINKFKNTIARQEKEIDSLNSDLKQAHDQVKQLTFKLDAAENENLKNAEIITQTLSSVVSMKKTATSNLKQSAVLLSRKKDSLLENLVNSRAISSGVDMRSIDMRRVSQILENTSKEQFGTIACLQEALNHYKENTDKLEKQISTMTFMNKSSEEKMQETIDELNSELDEAHNKLLDITNSYEDRISKLETEINKKDKDVKLQKSTIGSLRYELESLKKKMEIFLQDTEIRDVRFSEKTEELAGEVQFHELTIGNLENQIAELEKKNYELEEELESQREQRAKKEKYIHEINDKFKQVCSQNEENLKYRKELLEKTLEMKEEILALKDDNEKTKQMLKQEEKNNKKLQEFSNDLIKQKEAIVKVELESSNKSIELESNILQINNSLESLEEQIRQKEEQVNQAKSANKGMQGEIKRLESEVKEYQMKINQLNMKWEEKEKKWCEKEGELREKVGELEESYRKQKEELSMVKEEKEKGEQEWRVCVEEKEMRIYDLDKEVSTLKIQVQSLSNEIIQKEELLFFEKQRASLSESSIHDLKKQSSQTNLIINKYENDIKELNEELAYKEEVLYEYSGKIYELEQAMEGKEEEAMRRVEKMDMDWQCRHDEICEEYEQRIEFLEKDKKYVKDKLDLLQEEQKKVAEEKRSLMEQMEKDLGTSKHRSREMQEEKMMQLNSKNKEMEKMKNEMSGLNAQIKKLGLEIKKKDDEVGNKSVAIKKLESKMTENDRMVGELTKRFEKEVNELKKHEMALKNYKEEIKNAQWVIERESKKVTQIFIQKVINACPEAKEKLVQPIRALETSMNSVINFKV